MKPESDSNILSLKKQETARETAPKKKNEKLTSLIITFGLILSSSIIVWLFKDSINQFGVDLLMRFGQGWVDIILFLLTAVSCTPLVLPVWGYTLAGIALGYNVLRLAIVMGLGSTLGSFATYACGRYFSKNPWVKRRFPNLLSNSWSEGKSKKYVGWLLFLGTASPIPCDPLYAVCGGKQFPSMLFILTVLGGRFIRYLYLGLAFKYFGSYF